MLSLEEFKRFVTAVLSLLDNSSRFLIRGILIDELAYAYDTDQINENLGDLRSQDDNIQSTTSHFGITINPSNKKAIFYLRKPKNK